MNIEDKTVNLYSFDIFDTLITRKTATPRGIFALLSEKISKNPSFSDDFKKNFYLIRSQTENWIRSSLCKKNKSKVITYNEIYDFIKEKCSLSLENVEYLKNLEIELEKENIFPIKENVLKIKELIKENKHVVLISDMYFDSKTIRSFLTGFDDIFKNIKIYVSSEFNASKSSGELYKIVKEKENIDFKNQVHFGDNEKADYITPKKLGIKANLYNFKLEPYEQFAIKKNEENSNFQTLIGISKYIRNNLKVLKNREKYDFGASFSAPILYSYVTYILNNALTKGFKTIYFVARDGYIPKLIADIIIKNKNLPIKTKYIYGSRLAWRVMSDDNYDKMVEILFKEYSDTSKLNIKLIAYRLEMGEDTLLKYLPLKSANTYINPKKAEEIKKIFLENELIKEEIIKQSDKKRELLIKYLKQELDFGENEMAFADINGSGRTMEILAQYINNISPTVLYTYYITSPPVDKPSELVKKVVYLMKTNKHKFLLELISRTDSGQTTGYLEKDGKIFPQLEKCNPEIMYNWGYKDYLEGILDYCEIASKYEKNLSSSGLCLEYYNFINENCDKKTAEILGDVPFKEIGDESDITVSAPKLSFFQILKYFIFGKGYLKNSEIPELSLIRSGVNINKIRKFSLKFNFDFIIELKLKHILKANKRKKIALWGASIFLENFFKKYKINYDNIIVVDRNPNRCGQKIENYTIISPEELKQKQFDYMVMTIKNRNAENYNELQKLIKEDYPDKTLLKNIF